MNAGGMEYSGVAAISLDLYQVRVLDSGIPSSDYIEAVTAHEVAHQWFFNMVMNDQIDEPWLDEGMAQYATYLYYLDTSGEEGALPFHQTWSQRWSRVGNLPIPVGRPADAYTPREYSAIIYGRAPILIEKVAGTMGERAFNEFLNKFIKDNRWGIVDGHEFLSHAEASCECELEMIFREWVLEKENK